MKLDKNLLLWYFTSQLMNKEIVFSDVDYYNFSKACKLVPDMKEANQDFFMNNQPKRLINKNTLFTSSKSLLGPCYIHPHHVNPKKIEYNITKIINDLQLSKQNITPQEKLQKIIDYIGFLG
jgi:hypothetical protein